MGVGSRRCFQKPSNSRSDRVLFKGESKLKKTRVLALILAFVVAAMTSVSAHTYSFGMERTYIASGVPLQGSGEYNRSAAYNYAEKYWDEVCSDSYFVDTRTTFIYLDPGTDITGMTGFDCAHFVSCCIGNELHEPGGGLDVPSTAHLIYGELGATQLGDWLIVSGNGVERAAITGLMVGDVISYDWDGDGHWDHVTPRGHAEEVRRKIEETTKDRGTARQPVTAG